jgi:predicted Zn-dependent peptidase
MSSQKRMKAGVQPLPSARLQTPGTTKTLLKQPDGSVVKRTVLPGGLRVITEHVPGVRSVSMSIWAGVGSRDESAEMAGSAHFLEHLLFKGTKTREAIDISSPIDAVGGEMNAFTSKEYTCYYARVLDTDVALAVDVLADMLTNSLIRPADFAQEQNVILEEIAMRDDDHADNAHEAFAQGLFGESDLGRPILGTVDTIKAANRDAVWKFYRKHYTPNRLVIAAAGALDHAEVVRLVKKSFAHVIGGSALPVERRKPRAALNSKSSIHLVNRKTEQSHLIWGVPGFARGDDRRFAVGVLNAVLGGGMSSRLFQEVREKRGLAYSVYSFSQSFADTGYFGVYSGSIPSKMPQALDVIKSTVASVADVGLSDDEIARGKGQLRGSLVLTQEDTSSRMTRIAKAELISGELPSVDRTLELIDEVTAEEIHAVANQLFSQQSTIGVVGPYKNVRQFTSAMGKRR